MSVFEDRRHVMVESQLRTNKVTDAKVIEAFEATAKERFLDDAYKPLAYMDETLMLEEGRFVLAPMVFGRLVQALELNALDNVLDIGAASGYSTAVLARLAQSVVGIESNERLAHTGQANLTATDTDNAVIIEAPLEEGLANEAPYNAIIIEGSVEDVPQGVLHQLAEDGRLVAIRRSSPTAPGKAVKYVRTGNGFAHSTLFDAQTPMLGEFAKEKVFSF